MIRISPKATRVDIDKTDFDELVSFFCENERALEFYTGRISTNPSGSVWVPDSKGWTEEENRSCFDKMPCMISKAAEIYCSVFRQEGGRFWINFEGAFSIKTEEYFVLWVKPYELRLYVRNLRKDLLPFKHRDFVIQCLTSPQPF
jgi:hypothetical protein